MAKTLLLSLIILFYAVLLRECEASQISKRSPSRSGGGWVSSGRSRGRSRGRGGGGSFGKMFGPACRDDAPYPQCSGGQGECADGRCVCIAGFSGRRCELRANDLCKEAPGRPACSGNGECVDGRCECYETEEGTRQVLSGVSGERLTARVSEITRHIYFYFLNSTR